MEKSEFDNEEIICAFPITAYPKNPLHSYDFLEFKQRTQRFMDVMKLKTYTKSYKQYFEKLVIFINKETEVLQNLQNTPAQPQKMIFLKLKMLQGLCVSG